MAISEYDNLPQKKQLIDILKDAELIELVKMEEVRGVGVLKYYTSSEASKLYCKVF